MTYDKNLAPIHRYINLWRSHQGNIYAGIVVLIWTGFILVSRVGGKSLLTPWDIIAIRYTSSACILLCLWWYWKRPKLLTRQNVVLAFFGGLLYALCAFSGFKLASAAQAAVLLAGTLPFSIALCTRLILKEKLQLTRLLGLGIIAMGVICLGVDQFLGGISPSIGIFLLLGASLSWAIYTTMLRRWHADPQSTAIAVTVITLLIYMPFYLFLLPKNINHAPIKDIALQAFYQGIMATVVQMLLYIQTVKLIGASRMGIWMAFIPLLAGLLAIPVLNEHFTQWLFFGLILVSVGAWFSQQTFFNRTLTMKGNADALR